MLMRRMWTSPQALARMMCGGAQPYRHYSSGMDAHPSLSTEAIQAGTTVAITSFNFEKEIVKCPTPTLLIFSMDSAPECKQYVATAKTQALQRNTADGAIVIRIATVNCERELAIAKQFRIDQMGVPMTYFLYKGQMIDRANGALTDVHVRNAIDAFLNVVKTQLGAVDNAEAELSKQRMSENEENPLTLIQAGARALQEGTDVAKGKALFEKALEMTKEPIAQLKKSIGIGQRKPTPEMQNKMKESVYTQAAAKALAMMSICELTTNNMPKAVEYTKELRAEYPWAVKDYREIAEAVARVEMMNLVGFNTKIHNYASLLKKDDVVSDPEVFYALHLRLAVCHYIEKKPQLCIDELLKLIRAEPKLGKAPKKPGETTMARQLILMVFDAIGSSTDMVQDGRKKLSTYLFC
jgi:thioredoxin-like negative regulator of GroEL